MSEPRRAALLLPQMHPVTQAERDTFAAQQLACRLYAGNHDLVIVGLYAPPDHPRGSNDPELPAVEIGSFDIVLAVAPLLGDDNSALFAQTCEQLRAQQVETVLLEPSNG